MEVDGFVTNDFFFLSAPTNTSLEGWGFVSSTNDVSTATVYNVKAMWGFTINSSVTPWNVYY